MRFWGGLGGNALLLLDAARGQFPFQALQRRLPVLILRPVLGCCDDVACRPGVFME